MMMATVKDVKDDDRPKVRKLWIGEGTSLHATFASRAEAERFIWVMRGLAADHCSHEIRAHAGEFEVIGKNAGETRLSDRRQRLLESGAPSPTKPTLCPECGYQLEASTYVFSYPIDINQVTDLKAMVPTHTLEPGGITMCIRCTQFLEVTKNGDLRALSGAEFKRLPSDLRDALHRMRRIAQEETSVVSFKPGKA